MLVFERLYPDSPLLHRFPYAELQFRLAFPLLLGKSPNLLPLVDALPHREVFLWVLADVFFRVLELDLLFGFFGDFVSAYYRRDVFFRLLVVRR